MAFAELSAGIYLGSLLASSGIDEPSAVPAGDVAGGQSRQVVTNISQFRALPSQDFLRGCPFHLTGIVTLVDTNRSLVVLQDGTGSVAVNLKKEMGSLMTGELVSLQADGSSPYVAGFPDFPYRPSGSDLRSSFEAPSNWGDNHLTRMRGYLHPPVTGEYTFWIASDNSSELWLSSDEDPANVRKIAYVRQGDWVNSREWSRYASQRSETIVLRDRQAYYIEAFQEQLKVDDNLAVAWQVAGLKQSVIDGRYLSPCVDVQNQKPLAGTRSLLREYWTNYSAGSLMGLTGPRSYESALAAKEVQVTVLGPGTWPEPHRITLDRPLSPEDQYRWVEAEGTVSFKGTGDDTATLELTDGQERVQVRAPAWNAHWPRLAQNWRVRVRGVCEGVRNANGELMPGFIWAAAEANISFIEPPKTNAPSVAILSPRHFTATSGFTNRAWGGFLSARGVVTFNDRVLGRDCLYIQDDTTGIFISQADRHLGDELHVGQWVELGGGVQPGRYAPNLHPMVVNVLGWRPMPEPATEFVEVPVMASRDGQWTEIEGVVRSVNADGTMVLMGSRGPVAIWVGRVATNVLSRYVDCTVRLRGVLSLTMRDGPMLLAPSAGFVEVEEETTTDPFTIPSCSIGAVEDGGAPGGWVHRVKVAGEVTCVNGRLIFVQDASGGGRVETPENRAVRMGDWVEAVGFPEVSGSSVVLRESLLRRCAAGTPAKPRKTDPAEAMMEKCDGILVECEATLLAQKSRGGNPVLELQEGQRVFEAVLAATGEKLPFYASGSTLRITGVCEVELLPAGAGARAGAETIRAASVQIRMRSPADVVLVKGPPLWNWKEAVALSGLLLAVVLGALFRIYLLRRRFERQQAARLAFSQQVLQSQEIERHRIAANLHDSLGQSLLIIKNQARMAMQPVTDESVQRRLDEISGVASQAIKEVRQITHDLRPYQLDTLGLTQAIRAVIQRVAENSPILFESHVDDIDGLMNPDSEIHVYRIVQECLNNIVKHSAAVGATVVVRKETGAISLSIRDNGRGFEVGLINSTGLHDAGFGLSGISERARILGGKLAVDSEPGRGTHVTVSIPLSALKHET
jgi:signal transduction histidine kinase